MNESVLYRLPIHGNMKERRFDVRSSSHVNKLGGIVGSRNYSYIRRPNLWRDKDGNQRRSNYRNL